MEHKLPSSGYILGLDVGKKRIGVAAASAIAKLPQPLDVISADETALDQIIAVANKESAELIVVDIPRNLDGQETSQSQSIRDFTTELAAKTDIPIIFADESLSSVRAEGLQRNNNFTGASSDSLAACFILEEYFVSNSN